MSGGQRWTVTVLVTALVASAVFAAPGAALSADAMVDDKAPGAVGDYTVILRPEAGDAVARNGLKSVTLDFGADRDYSGDLGNLTARDVEIRVGGESGTVWAGETSVSQNGSEVTITLEEAFRNVEPGDRIVVRVYGVTNTDIALRNAQTLRGFAMRVSATDPQGNTDGPVEARYTIDPAATPQQTPTDGANGSNAGGATDNASTSTAATSEGTESESPTAESTTDGAADATTEATSTEATSTETTDAATSTEATETTQPATTGGNQGGSGGQATETTGPGFGLLVGVVALLAAGLLATRRRD